MAKLPYQIRIEQDLLNDIKVMAIHSKRSVNNMIEVLLEYGLKYPGYSNNEVENLLITPKKVV